MWFYFLLSDRKLDFFESLKKRDTWRRHPEQSDNQWIQTRADRWIHNHDIPELQSFIWTCHSDVCWSFKRMNLKQLTEFLTQIWNTLNTFTVSTTGERKTTQHLYTWRSSGLIHSQTVTSKEEERNTWFVSRWTTGKWWTWRVKLRHKRFNLPLSFCPSLSLHGVTTACSVFKLE